MAFRTRPVVLAVAAVVSLSACSSAQGGAMMFRAPSLESASLPQPTAPATTVVEEAPSPTTSAPSISPVLEPTTTAPPPTSVVVGVVAPAPIVVPAPPRVVVEQAWTPFATVGGLTLVHPSSRVERIGFHQSNHDGAQQLDPLPSAVAPATMETRDRLTGGRTAADVVIDPAVGVRSPVTGTVKRAGTYVLYCDYSDDYAVIQPDGQPGWEVKVLHIDGVRVGPGERVTAGQTVIAGGPTPLPFESQVDELTTAASAWPHVHIEVIDLAIPDVPSRGGGCT